MEILKIPDSKALRTSPSSNLLSNVNWDLILRIEVIQLPEDYVQRLKDAADRVPFDDGCLHADSALKGIPLGSCRRVMHCPAASEAEQEGPQPA